MVFDTAGLQMFVKCNQPSKALELWNDMVGREVVPTYITYVCVFGACAALGAVVPSVIPIIEKVIMYVICSDMSFH